MFKQATQKVEKSYMAKQLELLDILLYSTLM